MIPWRKLAAAGVTLFVLLLAIKGVFAVNSAIAAHRQADEDRYVAQQRELDRAADAAQLREQRLKDSLSSLRDSLNAAIRVNADKDKAIHAQAILFAADHPARTARDSAADELIASLDDRLMQCHTTVLAQQRLEGGTWTLVAVADLTTRAVTAADSARVKHLEDERPGWLKRAWDNVKAPAMFTFGLTLGLLAGRH